MEKALKQTIEFGNGTFTLINDKKETVEFTVTYKSMSGYIENIKIVQDLSLNQVVSLALYYDYDGTPKTPSNRMQAKRSIKGTFTLINTNKLEILGNKELSTQELDIEIESVPDAVYDKWMATRQTDVNRKKWNEYQTLWLSSDTTSHLSFYPESGNAPASWYIMTHLRESLFESLCEKINQNSIQSILCYYQFPLVNSESNSDWFFNSKGLFAETYFVPPACHEEDDIEIFDANASTRVFGYLDKMHFTEYEKVGQRIIYTPNQIQEALKVIIKVDVGTQFGQIATEILTNVKNHELDKSKFSVHSIYNLLMTLKFSYTKDPDIEKALLSEEFDVYVAKLSAEKKTKAISLNEKFWHHADFMNLMRLGQLHKGEYDELDVWALEDTARIYLENDWMHSETLEWLLVDALMFSETASFTRVATKPPTIFNLNILPILKELFYLGLTAIVSALFSSEKTGADVIFWIIFSAITIIRWLNPYQVDKNKPKKLAAEMVGVYEELKRMDFNPKVLQMLLFDLEKKGAYYSPMIYNILDRKRRSCGEFE